jgi:hypothetical protein
MKIILVLLIIFNIHNLFGQNLEIFGGANKNVFHHKTLNNDYSTKYNSDKGFSVGIGIEHKSNKIDWYSIRFTLQFERYSGSFETSEGGLGSKNTTIAEIDKSVISFGFFPLNFNLFKRIDLGFGFLASGLIHESYNGTLSVWTMFQPTIDYDLKDVYDRYSSKFYFGLQGRIAYKIKLSESIFIMPQYLYYYGLAKEFVELPKDTKSIRHYLCVGIMKKL